MPKIFEIAAVRSTGTQPDAIRLIEATMNGRAIQQARVEAKIRASQRRTAEAARAEQAQAAETCMNLGLNPTGRVLTGRCTAAINSGVKGDALIRLLVSEKVALAPKHF